MKNLLITITTFLTINLSAQNMTPVTRADVNEINLKLEKVDRFGIEHRLGNKIKIIGSLTTLTGILLIEKNYGLRNYTRNLILPDYNSLHNIGQGKSYKTGRNVMLIGLGITTIGITININSYRHLKFTTKKRVSITLK